MDEQQVMAMMAMPKEDINFVPAKGGDEFHIGAMHIRILEDGSRTSTYFMFGIQHHPQRLSIKHNVQCQTPRTNVSFRGPHWLC